MKFLFDGTTIMSTIMKGDEIYSRVLLSKENIQVDFGLLRHVAHIFSHKFDYRVMQTERVAHCDSGLFGRYSLVVRTKSGNDVFRVNFFAPPAFADALDGVLKGVPVKMAFEVAKKNFY